MYSFYTLILYLFSTILWVNSMLNNVLFAFNSILILYSSILYLFYTLNNVLILYYTTCSKTGLDLYFLGDDALISKGSFMQPKYLCVLIR